MMSRHGAAGGLRARVKVEIAVGCRWVRGYVIEGLALLLVIVLVVVGICGRSRPRAHVLEQQLRRLQCVWETRIHRFQLSGCASIRRTGYAIACEFPRGRIIPTAGVSTRRAAGAKCSTDLGCHGSQRLRARRESSKRRQRVAILRLSAQEPTGTRIRHRNNWHIVLFTLQREFVHGLIQVTERRTGRRHRHARTPVLVVALQVGIIKRTRRDGVPIRVRRRRASFTARRSTQPTATQSVIARLKRRIRVSRRTSSVLGAFQKNIFSLQARPLAVTGDGAPQLRVVVSIPRIEPSWWTRHLLI